MKYLRFTVSSGSVIFVLVGVAGALAVTVRRCWGEVTKYGGNGLNGSYKEAAGHKGSEYKLHAGWLDGCGSCRGAGSIEILLV